MPRIGCVKWPVNTDLSPYPFLYLINGVSKQTVTLTLATPFLSQNVQLHLMRTDSFTLNMEMRKLKEGGCNEFNEPDAFRVV